MSGDDVAAPADEGSRGGRRSGLMLFVALSLANASNYVFQVIASRLLGPADYSLLGGILSVVTVLGVSTSALQTAAAKAVAARGGGEGQVVLDPLARRVLRWACVAAVLVLLISPVLASFLHAGLLPTVLLAAYVVPVPLLSIGLGRLQGGQAFIAFGLISLGLAVGRLVVAPIAVAVGLGVAGVLGATIAVTAVGAAVALRRAARYGPLRPRDVGGDVARSSLALGLFWLLVSLDVLIARNVLDATEAGQYTAASVIGKAVLWLPGAVALVMFPRVASAREQGALTHPLLMRALATTIGLCAVGVVALRFLGPAVIPAFFGDAYAAGAGLAWKMGAATLPFAAANVLVFYHLTRASWRFTGALVLALAVQIIGFWRLHDGVHDLVLVLSVTGVVLVGGLVLPGARRRLRDRLGLRRDDATPVDSDAPPVPAAAASSTPWRRAARRPVALASVGFVLMTLAYLGPPATTRCSTDIVGSPGDATAGGVWSGWQYEEEGQFVFTPKTPVVNVPNGSFFWRPIGVTALVPTSAHYLLVRAAGAVCGWNLLMATGLALNGITMFAFLHWLLRRPSAAFLGAAAFAFTPYHLYKVGGHPGGVHTWVFPLLLWWALALCRRPNVRLALLLGATLAFAGYVDGYFLLMGPVLTTATVLGYLVVARREVKRVLTMFAMAGAVAIAGLLPIAAVQLASAPEISSTLNRNEGELRTYSARPLEYVVPAHTHPVFGDEAGDLMAPRLHDSNFVEQSLYVGVSVLVLATIFAVFALSRPARAVEAGLAMGARPVLGALLAVLVAGLLWSAPPSVGVAGLRLSMPSGAAFAVAPYWRVFARFFIVVDVAVAAAAAIGVATILRRGRRSGLVIAVLTAVVLFDLATMPPRQTWSYATETPAVYSWLARQPDHLVVAEYPLVVHPRDLDLHYRTFQPVHEKRLVNGAFEGTADAELHRGIFGLTDPQSVPVLRHLGADLLIVHGALYASPLTRPPDLPGATLVKTFAGGDYVYRVDRAGGPPPGAIGVKSGFDDEEASSLTGSRWLSRDGALTIRALGSDGPYHASLDIAPFGFARTVTIEGDGVRWVGEISAERRVTLLVPHPQTLSISFTPPATEVQSLHPRSHDTRALGIAVTRFEVTHA